MKSDFVQLKAELTAAGIGILDVCRDFYMDPIKRGCRYWVKSPCNEDKHPSLALWPDSNTFTDFSNGNYGGDMIGFISYVKGINAWQAIGVLRERYGLSTSPTDAQDRHREVAIEKEKEQALKTKRDAYRRAWNEEVEKQKRLEERIDNLLSIAEPMSDTWCRLIDYGQSVSYWLDYTCGVYGRD